VDKAALRRCLTGERGGFGFPVLFSADNSCRARPNSAVLTIFGHTRLTKIVMRQPKMGQKSPENSFLIAPS
jgi:hypothetical protein